MDDPITLPKQMVELGMQGGGWLRDGPGVRDATLIPSVRYGLTDRLTLDNLTMLKFALLDDAPSAYASTGARATEAPLSLALVGGLREIGYSTFEGLIVSPEVGVSAHKHIGTRTLIGGHSSGGIRLRRSRSIGWMVAGASILVQATQTVAVELKVHAGWGFQGWDYSSDLGRSSKYHWVSAVPGISYRPWHWITFGLDFELRTSFWRASTFEPTPDGPIPMPGGQDRSPLTEGRGLASVRFHW